MGVQFVPLTFQLANWFERELKELPQAIQETLNGDPIFNTLWDSITPDQRRSAAAQSDYNNDPATEAERKYYWNIWCDIDELETEVARRKNLRPESYEGDYVKRKEIGELESRIERLKKSLDTPPPDESDVPEGPLSHLDSRDDQLTLNGTARTAEVIKLGSPNTDSPGEPDLVSLGDQVDPSPTRFPDQSVQPLDSSSEYPSRQFTTNADESDGDGVQRGEDADYLFLQKGDGWLIRYAGKEAIVKSQTGLHLYRYLLSQPQKSFSSMELRLRFNPAPPTDAAVIQMDSESTSEHMQSIDGMDANYVQMDPKGLLQIKQRAQILLREVEAERDQGNLERVAVLEEEVREYTTYLRDTKGLRGKSRTFKASVDNIRSALSMSLKRARQGIGKHLPDLEQHLARNVSGRGGFCYKPEVVPDWKF